MTRFSLACVCQMAAAAAVEPKVAAAVPVYVYPAQFSKYQIVLPIGTPLPQKLSMQTAYDGQVCCVLTHKETATIGAVLTIGAIDTKRGNTHERLIRFFEPVVHNGIFMACLLFDRSNIFVLEPKK